MLDNLGTIVHSRVVTPTDLLAECARVARQFGVTRAVVRSEGVEVEIELGPMAPPAAQPTVMGGSPDTQDELERLAAEWPGRVGATR